MRQGLPARQVMLPAKEGQDSLATALWHSTRWCHVLVRLGTWATVLHAQAAYGVSGQPALNRAFWQQALDYAARHGAAPQLIAGDFNFRLDDLLQAPPRLQGLLLTLRLVNSDSELAAAAGRPPLCSYVGVREGHPTRIDGLLVDTRLAALLRGSEVLPACGIPHHRPVRFDLLAEGAVQSVVKLMRLPRVVIPPLPEEERVPVVQSLLDPLGPRWHAELTGGDRDRLWSTWTWAAEETLLALSVLGLWPGAELPAAPPNYNRGRGTVRLLKRVRLCPRQRRTTGDPVACPWARLQAVQGLLRTIVGWLKRPDPRRRGWSWSSGTRCSGGRNACTPLGTNMRACKCRARQTGCLRRQSCVGCAQPCRAASAQSGSGGTKTACRRGGTGSRTPGPPSKARSISG